MKDHPEHDLSHRQQREHKKEEHQLPEPGRRRGSLHPAWYVVLGVILIGTAMLIWISLK
jgi:hypothetical protein